MAEKIRTTFRVTGIAYEDGIDDCVDEQSYRVTLEATGDTLQLGDERHFGELSLVVRREVLTLVPLGHDVVVMLEIPGLTQQEKQLQDLKEWYLEQRDKKAEQGEGPGDPAMVGEAAKSLADFVVDRWGTI